VSQSGEGNLLEKEESRVISIRGGEGGIQPRALKEEGTGICPKGKKSTLIEIGPT